jgi:hypothetical protein
MPAPPTMHASIPRRLSALLLLPLLATAFFVPNLPTRLSHHQHRRRCNGAVTMSAGAGGSTSPSGAKAPSTTAIPGSAKGDVTLGPYKNGALHVRVKRPQVHFITFCADGGVVPSTQPVDQ